MPPGMDALGLKLLVQIRLRCHTQSLLRKAVWPSPARPASRSVATRHLN
jgi:hypothetical protein